MATGHAPTGNKLYLGIECGGTHTVALLADERGQLARRVEAGPANLRLFDDAQLLRHFRSLAREFPRPAALGIGMAGMRTGTDHRRILTAAAKAWPRVPCAATDDLETALAAAGRQKAEFRMQKLRQPKGSSFVTLPSSSPCVLVLSGTGSCCYGKDARGRTAKVGGWGHILGDGGSGYDIGLNALREVLSQCDHTGELPRLGQSFLRRLLLNEPNQFVAWAQTATKAEIAGLALEVFAAADRRDKIAAEVLANAAQRLAAEAVACAKQLTGTDGVSPSQTKGKQGRQNALPPKVEFVLAGGNLLKQPRFAGQVAARIRQAFPQAVITPLDRESAWGAVELAQHIGGASILASRTSVATAAREDARPTSLSPTEQRNPRSMKLDRLTTAAAIKLMLSEDAKIPGALRAEREGIERAVGFIASAFRRGGRLFYVGAGTSGRLGILDASECPPTFRTPPELVQGIIAGGQTALWQAVEGAEDDDAAGARAMTFRGVTRRDVVVGIAASGRTPFVWGALNEAKRRGAKTILLCFNPLLKVPRARRPNLVIAPDIGPEILTGSTRLKAGTATKLLLNIFTTLAMVRLGKVAGNLMVDLKPGNAKLRDRAVRIVRELTGADEDAARRALFQSGWVVKAALRRLTSKRQE